MPQGLLYTQTDSLFMRKTSRMAKFFSEPRRSFFFVIAVCFTIYMALYIYILPPQVVIDNQYGQNVNEKVILERRDYKSSVIEKQCSEATKTCYIVIDKKIELENYGELVERNMVVEGFDEDSDTVVLLIPPKGAKFDTSDTRMWKVDHYSVRAQYIAALISAPFIVSTLSLIDRDNDDKKVLEIGLGGGSFDMFLHEWNRKINITAVELDPIVAEISKKWFDVVDDSTRKTIVTDGLKFINNSVSNGDVYDVVILDACDSSKPLPCPGAIFRKREIIDQFSKIVSENGVLVVNILSYEENTSFESDKIIEMITEVFRSCIRVTLTKEVNIIAICTHQSISDNQNDFDFLKKRAHAVINRLGLENILQNIVIR